MTRARLRAASALGLLLAATVVASSAPARPRRGPPRGHHHAARPSVPIPSLPVITRVRLEVARDRLVLIEDVTLARGDWDKGDLDVYVAFPAPGAPRAVDAHLVAVRPGETEPRLDDGGEVIPTERSPHRPPNVQALLGRPTMAGVILHLREGAIRRALAQSDVAGLRLRTLLDLPAEDDRKARELVVRLGIHGSTPLTLGRVELVSLETKAFLTRAEAQLCGADADPWPLSLQVSPALPSGPRGTILPAMAVRHASDDLCVRFWTR